MVKTYFKTVRRMFRHHLIRLFSLIGIILISVGFISGIGSPTDMIRDSMENYYRNQNVSDFIVKSKTGSFSEEQIAAVRSRYGEKHVNTGMSLDIQTGEKRSLRLYFLDFDAWSINVPELADGEKVTGDGKNRVYAEAADNVIKGYSIGEEVEIKLFKPIDKCKVFSGILESFDADTVTITEEGTPRTFARADIALIRLALDF